MNRVKRAATALVISVAVYLTPTVGPHAVFVLGEVVWRDLGNILHGGRDHDLAWAATDIGVALMAQIAFFLLVYWFLARPGWRRTLCLGLPIVPALIALNYAYMVAIPTYFLIEPDTTAERGTWSLECTVRDVWIPAISSPPGPSRSAAIWLADVNPPHSYALFNPTGCELRRLELAQSAEGHVTYVAGAHALYKTMTPATWFVFDAAANTKTPVDVGEGQSVILSNDGGSVAWLRPVAGVTSPVQFDAVIRRVDGRGDESVDLSALGRGGSQQLISFDSEAGELVVARGLSELLWVGVDGRIRKILPRPAGVAPQPQTFRILPGGWVAWDAYRENQPYRVAWELPGGNGSHQVLKGRSITSLAVSPDGNLIGLSVTSSLSIGSTPDAVSVLRVADGAVVFHKFLPKYTRSTVAFPDSGRFVYTDLEGVRVLKIE